MFREFREVRVREVERSLSSLGFDPDRRIVVAMPVKDKELGFDPDKLIFNPDRRI